MRGNVMAQRGATLKKLADAAGPLYKSLDDAQKHRFMVLARLNGPRHHAWRGKHGHRGQGMWQHQDRRGPAPQ
jgi:hypothetical protein